MSACGSGREALAAIQSDSPDVVLADLRLPDLEGLNILQALNETNPDAAFIVITGYATLDTAVEALNQGAYAYVNKPFNMDEVHSIVRNAVTQQQLVTGNRRLLGILRQTNAELNQEVAQRARTEDALQNSLERLRVAYDQATTYAEELREEIAQRRRAERALERSEELRRLQAAQEATDQERKRLAEELHDEALAELSSVVVDLGFLRGHSAQMPPDQLEVLEGLRTRVRDTEMGLRQVVKGLSPAVLTNLGLMPALRSYLEDLARRPITNPGPLEIEIRAVGLDDGRLPEKVEIAVYRAVQQGLVNAIQHAGASKLRIELTWAGAWLEVTIADDGAGFDLADLERTQMLGHFGLVNLKDRIEGIDGTLEIESRPTLGTTLRAKVPTESRGPATPPFQVSTYLLRHQNALDAAR